MKTETPTLNDFMMVESLAHHQSVNLTAKELKISPSALSRQLSALEAKLGVMIFERDTRNFMLTESGLEFVQIAKKVLLETVDNLGFFKPYLKCRLLQLSISVLPSITGMLLPKLLKEFIAKNPEINLVVSDEHPQEIIKTIEHGIVDLGLTVGTVAIKNKLSFMPLIEEKFVIISCNKDMSMLKDDYSFKDIVEMPIITAKKGTSYRDYLDLVCERENLHFTPHAEVTQVATAVAMVSEGMGVTILPKLILPIICTKNLKFHNIRDLNKSNEIGIAYLSSEAISPIANRFLNHVKFNIQPLYESLQRNFPI